MLRSVMLLTLLPAHGLERALVVLAFIVLVTPVSAQVLTADVTGGTVQGVAAEGVAVFKGIPFAAPPVGENRWRAPQPVEAWTGVRPADRFADACMQPSIPRLRQLRGADVGIREDCLYLNVWTPAESAGDELPVMVWIHGGGFLAGATSHDITAGARLAERGVVVVSVAYRFGVLGFLAHAELSAESGRGSGNYAWLDQIAGLEWVQQNIAAFGGDPSNVTIFGQSAGGISVSILAGSPAASGLFDRVISQSGGFFGPRRTTTPLAVAEAAGETYLKALGASSIAEARAFPAETIVGVRLPEGQRFGSFFVADGHVMLGDQYVQYGQGQFNDTPVLIGTNSDEGTLDAGEVMTAARLEAMVRSEYGDHADRILAAYPHATDQEASQSAKNISRDLGYAWPTWTWARLQSRHGEHKAFVYYFDQQPSGSTLITENGAGHGAEVVFVFGTIPASASPPPEDLAASDLMGRYWTNFAKTGDPNGAGLPSWPAFDEDEQQVMVFDDDTGARGISRIWSSSKRWTHTSPGIGSRSRSHSTRGLDMSRLIRWIAKPLKWLAIGAVALIVIIVLAGNAYRIYANAWIAEEFPPPGRMVSVGSVESRLADLEALLDISGEAGPYIFVGHSGGAVFALLYAQDHRDKVSGVITVNGGTARILDILALAV